VDAGCYEGTNPTNAASELTMNYAVPQPAFDNFIH
jgi:hypothetical protein